MGRDSSVCVATRYGWLGWGSNPGGMRFSAPVQTSPGAHPASYTTDSVSFQWVKWPGCVVDHPSLSSVKFKGSRGIPLHSFWAFVACSRVNFTFTFSFNNNNNNNVSLKY